MKKTHGWIQNIFKCTIRLHKLDNSPRYTENLIAIVFLLSSLVREVTKVGAL